MLKNLRSTLFAKGFAGQGDVCPASFRLLIVTGMLLFYQCGAGFGRMFLLEKNSGEIC